MRAPLEVAGLVLVIGAFSLVHAAARGQPLARSVRARAAARALALLALVLAACTVAAARGPGESTLLVIFASSAAASIFVPLAAVRPRWAWCVAAATPVIWALLAVASRGRGS